MMDEETVGPATGEEITATPLDFVGPASLIEHRLRALEISAGNQEDMLRQILGTLQAGNAKLTEAAAALPGPIRRALGIA